MEYDFELMHITGKKNGRADTLSRCPDYDQGNNDNKGLVVLPPKFFSKMYDKYVGKKEERTPLSDDKRKPQKELTTSARVAGSEEADPNNGPEWRRYLAGIDPVPFDSLQRQVERDQETEKSQERLQKWTNTHQLIKEGSFWWKNDQLVVAGDNNLKRGVISLFHDKPSAGHPGITNTYELARKDFWWPNMKQDIKQYVKGCGACQVNKINTKPLKPAMIPITPEHSLPFQTVTMDFITKLPKSGKYNTILTITDHDCSKAAIFVPCQETVTAEEVAAIYLRHVYKQYGVAKKIISDRDTRFTSKFAKGLCKTLDIHQNISTAYHPRTDGQSERTNQWVEMYLRFFINHQQDNWVALLPLAEFAHNNWRVETTGESPFRLLMGYHPCSDWTDKHCDFPQVTKRLQQLREIREQAHQSMVKAQNLWVKYKDTPRYGVGDLVWLDGHNLRTEQPTAKLAPRRHGPFLISRVLSPIIYQLTLPAKWRIHPVFHTDLLTPYCETTMHGKNYTYPPPDLIDGEEEYEVEKVLDSRRKRRRLQYLVKWKGYPDSDNQWIDQQDMVADEAIRDFQKNAPTKETHLKVAHNGEVSHQLTPIHMSSHASPTTQSLILPGRGSDDLAEALGRFPTPDPGRLSPDSTATSYQTLAPATGIASGNTTPGNVEED